MKAICYSIYLFIFTTSIACSPKINEQGAIGQSPTAYPLKKIALQNNGKKGYIQVDQTPLTVLVFLSPECPLCKNYSLVLNTLHETFSSEVQFYGIVPGRTYSQKDVQRYVNDYKISFPVWIDREKQLSTVVRASVTPEVILLNKSGRLVYRGAIDDWVQALGQKKVKPQQHYLEEAITGYLQNKQVLVKQTSPIGCLINEF
jgi:thioredoxin-related protein